MKSRLSIFLVVLALGLLTGCRRERDQPASSEHEEPEKAKRRNEMLRELTKGREEGARLAQDAEMYRRQRKLADARMDAKIQRARLNGKWVAVACTSDGVVVDAALQENPWFWLISEGKILSMWPGEGIDEEEIRFAIDPSKKPMEIDLTDREQKTRKGIYEFDSQDLKICYALEPDGARPKDFNAAKDSKQILVIWKRLKE
jgi:uncharacterized protein (TIGR03067 family)